MADIRVVINGAGAAGIACAKMYIQCGVRKENILLLDSKAWSSRTHGRDNPYKQALAVDTPRRTLEDAAKGADVLVGLSVKGAFTPALLALLADKPIIFA